MVLQFSPFAHPAAGRSDCSFGCSWAADVVDAESVAPVLAPVTLDQLAAAGLVERSQGGVRSLIRIDPVDGLVVASDPQRPRQRFAADHVISVGPASRTLAAITIRREASTALDLCCGSGIQALLAARHCKQCRRDRPEPACVAAGRR